MKTKRSTIKFCGITNVADADAARTAGADFIGLIRASSPRRAELAVAKQIVHRVIGEIHPVLLYQNTPLPTILDELRETGAGWVQLHGSETPATIDKLRQAMPNLRVIRACPLGTKIDERQLMKYLSVERVSLPDVVLLDAHKGSVPPPSAVFRAAAAAVREAGIQVWRAGGLDCENIVGVRGEYDYDGYDVARGVECAPGTKDHEKMSRFVQCVRLPR